MGQGISAIITGLPDSEVEKEKEAQDALNALVTMAEDKAALHYAHVINNALDAKLLPVYKVITKMQQINCGVAKDREALKQNLERSIKNFVKGEIVDGLVAIASQSLATLTSNVSANKSQLTDYAITVGSLGGIGRIDYYMFYYRYTSKALIAITEDCLITSLVISSVDTSGLDPNDIRVLVQNNYSAPLPGDKAGDLENRQKKILDSLVEGIKEKSIGS